MTNAYQGKVRTSPDSQWVRTDGAKRHLQEAREGARGPCRRGDRFTLIFVCASGQYDIKVRWETRSIVSHRLRPTPVWALAILLESQAETMGWTSSELYFSEVSMTRDAARLSKSPQAALKKVTMKLATRGK